MRFSLLALVLSANLLVRPLQAQGFNLDVGQNLILAPTPSAGHGAAAGQAGVWNAVPPSFAPQALVDLGGATTGATVVADHTSSYNVFPSVMPPGDDQRLMEDLAALPNLGVLVTWSFAGLVPGNYDVYTYAADPSAGITTQVVVVGSPDPAQIVGGPWPGQHVLGLTYARHSVAVIDGTLVLELLGIGPPLFDVGALNGIQLVPDPTPVGTNYCGPAVVNSSGAPGTITATGSALAGQPLLLTAASLPQNQFGYFLASETQGLFNPPGSQGLICLSGTIGRFNAPSQVGNSGAGGTIELVVDPTSIPVNPPVAVAPGDTWNFQAWFRDLGPTSNFSDGVAVSFL